MQQIKCTRTLFRKNDKKNFQVQQPQNDLIIKTCDRVGVQIFKQARLADVCQLLNFAQILVQNVPCLLPMKISASFEENKS